MPKHPSLPTVVTFTKQLTHTLKYITKKKKKPPNLTTIKQLKFLYEYNLLYCVYI